MSGKGLKQFHGTWKECSTSGDSECLKAMGVCKTKRRILKKLKAKLKYDVQNDSKLIFTNKTFMRTEIIDLGMKKSFDSDLGTTENLHVLEGDVLITTVTMIKPSSNVKKLVAGDVITSKVSINGKGQLTSEVEVKGAKLTKIFKLKSGGDNDDDEEDKENAKLREMASKAEDDGDENDDDE